MKKTILTAAIALTAVLGISRSACAATSHQPEVSTTLAAISNVSEIEVRGNVQIYLTTASDEKVKVYDNYYAGDALVQEQNGILRITSYNAQKLVIWVTVNDLSKLSVFDEASVTSFGQLSLIGLDVNLYDRAVARLDMDAFDASFTLNDHSAARLSGKVENGSMQYSQSAHISLADLTASKLTKTIKLNQSRCDRNALLAAL